MTTRTTTRHRTDATGNEMKRKPASLIYTAHQNLNKIRIIREVLELFKLAAGLRHLDLMSSKASTMPRRARFESGPLTRKSFDDLDLTLISKRCIASDHGKRGFARNSPSK